MSCASEHVKKKQKKQPRKIQEMQHLIFTFILPSRVLLFPALMVIGLISDDKWCGICWEQLNILLNCGEEKHHRSLQPASSYSPMSHMSVRFTQWDVGVPGKNTQRYYLFNINLMSLSSPKKWQGLRAEKSLQYKMQNTFMVNPPVSWALCSVLFYIFKHKKGKNKTKRYFICDTVLLDWLHVQE